MKETELESFLYVPKARGGGGGGGGGGATWGNPKNERGQNGGKSGECARHCTLFIATDVITCSVYIAYVCNIFGLGCGVVYG